MYNSASDSPEFTIHMHYQSPRCDQAHCSSVSDWAREPLSNSRPSSATSFSPVGPDPIFDTAAISLAVSRQNRMHNERRLYFSSAYSIDHECVMLILFFTYQLGMWCNRSQERALIHVAYALSFQRFQ